MGLVVARSLLPLECEALPKPVLTEHRGCLVLGLLRSPAGASSSPQWAARISVPLTKDSYVASYLPVIPGFGLTLGYTVVYLSLIVLIPLAAMFVHAAQLTWDQFWNIISAPRVLAALKLSFSTALYAALINGVIGTLLAWVLVRYTFPGRKVIDAMIDLPFALPTAVAGIALTALYAPNGLVGQFATDLGFKIAYTPWVSPWR